MIELLIVVFIVANIFWFIHLLRINSRQERIARQIREEIGVRMAMAEEMLKNVFLLRCEKHGEMLFLYNAKTEEFVCQGKNLDEVADAFAKRFPNQKAIIAEGKEHIFKEDLNVAK